MSVVRGPNSSKRDARSTTVRTAEGLYTVSNLTVKAIHFLLPCYLLTFVFTLCTNRDLFQYTLKYNWKKNKKTGTKQLSAVKESSECLLDDLILCYFILMPRISSLHFHISVPNLGIINNLNKKSGPKPKTIAAWKDNP